MIRRPHFGKPCSVRPPISTSCTRSDETRELTQRMVAQANRSLDLLTADLEPALYDQPAFLEAFKQLALKSKVARIRILLQDNSLVRTPGPPAGRTGSTPALHGGAAQAGSGLPGVSGKLPAGGRLRLSASQTARSLPGHSLLQRPPPGLPVRGPLYRGLGVGSTRSGAGATASVSRPGGRMITQCASSRRQS